MPIFTGCTILPILPIHDPNEGRVITNQNFECLNSTIQFTISGSVSSHTIVQGFSGNNNIIITNSGVTVPHIYTVSLGDNINVNSLSASTVSADTYFIGGVPFTSVTSGLTYTNLTPTTATVGGVVAGSTFSGASIEEMFNTLLYPYQPPTFSSFLINSQPTTIEVGSYIPSGSTIFSWTTTNSSNITTNSVIIKDITNVTTLGSSLVNDGSEALVLPNNVTKTTATSNQWRIEAINTQSGVLSKNFNVFWKWRIHYGTDPNSSLTFSGITGLTSSSLSSGFAGTWSFAAGDYKYFSYPSLMGTASSFKDSSTNLDVAMEALYVISITNSFGISTTYNIHRTTNVLGSTINIIIS